MATNDHSSPLNAVESAISGVQTDTTAIYNAVDVTLPGLISGVQSDTTAIYNAVDVTLPGLISGVASNITNLQSSVLTINNYVSGLPGLDNPYKSRGVFSNSLNSFVTVFQTSQPCFAFIHAWAHDSASTPSEACVYAGAPVDRNLVAYAKLAAGTSQVVCCFPSYFDPYITVQTKSDGSVPLRVGITVNTDGGSVSTDYNAGGDLYILKNNPTLNTGTATTLEIANHSAAFVQWILLKPDLSAIAASTPIQSATLMLKSTDADNYTLLNIHAMIQSWVVGQATWNEYSTGNAWATAGCGSGTDYRASTEVSQSASFLANEWNSFDITSVVREWINGSLVNNGLILRCPAVIATDTPHSFYSFNSGTAANRPIVRVVTL